MQYLIIGNSVAGVSAARMILRRDSRAGVTIFSDEPYPYYSRLLLTYFLSGLIEETQLFPAVHNFLGENRVQVKLDTRILRIDPNGKTILSSSGEIFSYDKLLIATGSKAVVPDVPGKDLPGVFPLRNLDQAREIKKRIRPGEKAAVFGGGLVGLQVAQSLARRGMQITVVVSSDRLLSRNLDRQGSLILAAEAQKKGINFLFHTEVTEIGKDRKGNLVVSFRNRRKLRTDLAVWAKGVAPAREVVRGSGVLSSHGLLVGPYLETNQSGIFGAGDVIEFSGKEGMNPANYPIWPLAIEQGGVAGLNMTGHKTVFRRGSGMNVTELFGVKLAAMGEQEVGKGAETIRFEDPRRGIYRKLLVWDNRVVGAVLVGDIADCGMISHLIRNRIRNKWDFDRLIGGSAGISLGILGS